MWREREPRNSVDLRIIANLVPVQGLNADLGGVEELEDDTAVIERQASGLERAAEVDDVVDVAEVVDQLDWFPVGAQEILIAKIRDQ